jgi:hypothetical protein
MSSRSQKTILEFEANRKLSAPSGRIHSKNLAKISASNRRSAASATINVVVVTVENIVELGPER